MSKCQCTRELIRCQHLSTFPKLSPEEPEENKVKGCSDEENVLTSSHLRQGVVTVDDLGYHWKYSLWFESSLFWQVAHNHHRRLVGEGDAGQKPHNSYLAWICATCYDPEWQKLVITLKKKEMGESLCNVFVRFWRHGGSKILSARISARDFRHNGYRLKTALKNPGSKSCSGGRGQENRGLLIMVVSSPIHFQKSSNSQQNTSEVWTSVFGITSPGPYHLGYSR